MRASVRFVAGMTATLLTMVLLALPAAAQDYPGDEAEATGPGTVTQGEDVTFVGEGFEPGTEVLAEVLIRSAEGEDFAHAETLTADAEGRVAFTFGIPCTVMQGDQGTVTFTGDSGTASEDFVVGGEAAACPGGLPTTGSNITNGLLIVTAVVILGAGLVVASRRRGDEHVEQS